VKIRHRADNQGDKWVLQESEFLNPYLKNFIMPYIDKTDIVIDAGAHIGTFTVEACRKIAPNTLIAIEPEASNYKYLLQNIEEANIGSIVRARQVGLWDENTRLPLFVDSSNSGGHSFIRSKAVVEESRVQGNDASFITLRKLDDLLADEGLSQSPISILKVDVEGAEVKVFQGAQKALDRTSVVVGEVHESVISIDDLRHVLNDFILYIGEPTSPLKIRAFWAVNKKLLASSSIGATEFMKDAKLADLEDVVWRLREENGGRQIQIESNDPMSELLHLYYSRKDLQEAFPEVVSGNYDGLVKWANATMISKQDKAHEVLSSYKYWYRMNPFSELTKLHEESIPKLEMTIIDAFGQIALRDAKIEELEFRCAELGTQYSNASYNLGYLTHGLGAIQDSITYKLIRKYAPIVDRSFPAGTLRGKMLSVVKSRAQKLVQV